MTQEIIEKLFADAWLNLAAENYATALALIEKAIAFLPENPACCKLAADAFLIAGDASRALAFYATAFRAKLDDPHLFARVFHMAQLCHKADLVEEMEANIILFRASEELYAALADAYASTGNTAKAIAWFEAAYRLQHTVKYKIESLLLQRHENKIMPLLDSHGHTIWEQANESFVVPDQTLTCVVTTNLTKKLVVNKHKAPPKLDLIAETLASWRAAMQPKNTRVIINFDQPATPEPDAAAYAAALADYCAQHKYELWVKTANGLKQNVIDALADTNTGFFTLLEHDFLFHNCPTQANVMQEITTHPIMHVVQFNRRPNIAVRWDKHLWPEPRSTMPLLKTLKFSNNPAIIRTAKMKAHFMPLFSRRNEFDGTNAGAGGLEEIVKHYIANLAQQYGFGFTHRWSGYYLYGAALDAPRLTHTGI